MASERFPPVLNMWLIRRGVHRAAFAEQARNMLAQACDSPRAPTLIVRALSADIWLAKASSDAMRRDATAKDRAEYERVLKLQAAEWAAFEQECERMRNKVAPLLGFAVPGERGG